MGQFRNLTLILTSVFLVSFTSPNVILMDDMVVEKPLTEGAPLLKLQPWEDGVLPLDFDSSITATQQKQVLDACQKWSDVSPVKCVVGSYKNRVVKVTTYPTGCWALWGMGTHFMVLSRQINLAEECWKDHTLLHELGHAFGLIHEHQRADRDEFIKIKEENIGSFFWLQQKINFDKQDAVLNSPYDFLSVMHYSRKAFSKNGLDTIVPQYQYRQFIDAMGKRDYLSQPDGQVMTQLYSFVR